MVKTSTRVCAPLILFAAAGAVFAGPRPEGQSGLHAFDVSYQDGRTASKIMGPETRNHVLGLAESGNPDDLGPIATCFAEGTTPEVMAAVNAAMSAGYASRYQIGARWNLSQPGENVTLTWSFVPDGLSIPSGVGEATANSVLFSRMDTLFGTRNTWIAQFTNSFARWSALTGVSYTRVTAAGVEWDDGAAWGSDSGPNRGTIRISAKPIDGGSNILAYNAFPQNGDMVLDSAESWNSSGGVFLFLRNTIMHEHGHGLGLNHCCPGNSTKLMEPMLALGFDGPQQDEIRAIHVSYGDQWEPNNNSANATPLGTMTPGQTITLGTIAAPTVANSALLSLDASGEADWFSIDLADPRLVDITVTPVGNTYLNGPQNQNGSCSAGTNENSLAAADLMITSYKSNGVTVLRTTNNAAAGGVETVSGLMCASGTSFFKVTADGSPTKSQLYRLTVTVRNTNLTPSASEGTFTDKVRVTWAAVPDATSYQVYRNTTNQTFGGTTVTTISPPLTTQFDDTTADPGQLYYYFVRVIQPDDTAYRFTANDGDIGRRNAVPIADAGPDATVVDTDNSGSENVTLDASGSSDADGTIVIYRWAEGANVLSQTGVPTAVVSLSQGVHTLTLTTIDNQSGTNTDTVEITVVPPGGGCGTSDFNGDGDFGTDADIEAFFACLGGVCCPTCFSGGSDFNGDGDFGTDADIESFFRVLGGGNC
jgi:hypothetical protein